MSYWTVAHLEPRREQLALRLPRPGGVRDVSMRDRSAVMKGVVRTITSSPARVSSADVRDRPASEGEAHGSPRARRTGLRGEPHGPPGGRHTGRRLLRAAGPRSSQLFLGHTGSS